MKPSNSSTRKLIVKFTIISLVVNVMLTLLPGMDPVRAQDKIIIVNADQPNVWTLEQAHYLLAQMHRRNLDLKAKSLQELDPNTINGLRFDVLKTLIEMGVSYNQAAGVTNRLLKENKESDAKRRTEVTARRDKLREESLQLTRDITDLETQKARATTQDDKDRLEAEIASKNALRAKIDKEIEFSDNELKTLGDPSGEFTSTDAQVQFNKDKFPPSVFDEAFKDTAKTLIARFNQSPSLNASLMLENFLQMQYEIIAKQLTLLRDEVGPGERLLFLELPQTVNVVHGKADNRWAQSWWRIKGYTWRESQKDVAQGAMRATDRVNTSGSTRSSSDEQPSRSLWRKDKERPPVTTAEDYNALLNISRREDKNIRLFEERMAEMPEPYDFKVRFANLDELNPDPELTKALPDYAKTLSNRVVRTVELIPRQGSLNVNDMKMQTHSGAFSAVASFLFGFGARLNVQRQREQFSQFVQQELYSSAFGKGSREFGWTFTPMPGTNRLLSGVRTTYAAVIVPDNATSLVVESNGCYFPRTAYQPTSFADTKDSRWNVADRTSRNCGPAKAFVISIPNGGSEGSNDFWVRGISYRPVKKDQRVVVLISGSNFSSQIGVLVNGVPLAHSIGLAQPLIRDDSFAGAQARQELEAENVHGRIERIDSNKVVFSFEIPDFEGIPTITLVAPGKAIDLNWLENLDINGIKPATLSEHPSMGIDQAEWMFGRRPKTKGFRIDNLEVFRAPTGLMSGLVHGAGFKPQRTPATLFINGVRWNNWSVVTTELIEIPHFPAVADGTVQVTLVYDDDTIQSDIVANPGLIKVTKVNVLNYTAATGKRPGLAVAKIEGIGFSNRLLSPDPKRIRISVTSPTEAYIKIKDPDESEVVTLMDGVTRMSVTVVVVKPPPK